ncbi:hypothetical protein M422DRAFT_174001, partial [Sphaerobolus stellatus SS14]
CMPGTRESILNVSENWVYDEKNHNILFITGSPGAGKSAIASSLVSKLGPKKSARFFFNQDSKYFSKPSNVWRTIAYRLAIINQDIGKYLEDFLKKDPSYLENIHRSIDFKNLIVLAFQSIPAERKAQAPPVIIDALDEAKTSGLKEQKEFLQTLVDWAKSLPEFKLIVTSRNYAEIQAVIEPCSFCIHLPTGQAVDITAKNDICTFLAISFQDYKPILKHRFSEVINQLAEYAAGLFIWAKLVTGYITTGPFEYRLDYILTHMEQLGEINNKLDELYTHIFYSVLQGCNPMERRQYEKIFGALIFTKSPLSINILEVIFDAEESEITSTIIHAALGKFRPLLQSFVSEDGDAPLHLCHLSLKDFFQEDAEEGRYRNQSYTQGMKPEKAKRFTHICLGLLRCMNYNLHFNMGQVESSHFSNKDPIEVSGRLSKPLVFACQWWAEHLPDNEDDKGDEEIIEEVEIFLRKYFLYWLEVMSLLGQVPDAGGAMLHAENIFKDLMIGNICRDASHFIFAFKEAIATSTPRIYISALPLAPKKSLIKQYYIQNFPRILGITKGGVEDWVAEIQVLKGHKDRVISVAFSPDGKYIASGSADNTVCIWNAKSGQPVGNPLQGHHEEVMSVAFSSDGKYIVSGSFDKTIQIWNVKTGQAVREPLHGCQSGVRTVAFSPNGKHIVSCSQDKPIQIWDVKTGQTVRKAFQGHENTVFSVAFSPDGKYIVSGSLDKTVRIWNAKTVTFSPDGKYIASGSGDKTVWIWDAKTGEAVGKPLQGHQGLVNSVAFSPDGKHIISGSGDKTIQIWDVKTGKVVGKPLQDQSQVLSVAFSPDGKYIVSGGLYDTIRIWNAKFAKTASEPLHRQTPYQKAVVAFSPDGKHIVTGSLEIQFWDAKTGDAIGEPLQGYQSDATSVAFSPDGKYIVVGSQDNTVQIWNVETRDPVSERMQGHQKVVLLVAFSSDGNQIVSGSFDKTTRIWDAKTGQAIGEPCQGHQGEAWSMALSPNGQHIATGCFDKTIVIWDINTGQGIDGPLPRNQKNTMLSLAFSPDGKYLASGSGFKKIHIWNVETGEAVGEALQGQQSPVISVAFSPDGKEIVSSDGKTIRIHNLGEDILHPTLRTLNDAHGTPFFTNQCILKENGWLCLPITSDPPSEKLLLWIPPEYHRGLWWPGNTMVISEIPLKLDFSLFHHGEDWAACYRDNTCLKCSEHVD